jgi:hypothetical protein
MAPPVEVRAPIVKASWTASGALAFATSTQVYVADPPTWTVREVAVDQAKPDPERFLLLRGGYADKGTPGKASAVTLRDYAGKVLGSSEPTAYLFPSMLRKALTKCDGNGKRCKTTVFERTAGDWKPLRTFDALDDIDLASEVSPEEDFYVRGVGSDTYEAVSLKGSAPVVRIQYPHNRQLSVPPPPRFIPGFALIPARVGYRKVDATGAVKVSRSAPLAMPNGITATYFELASQRLLFMTQAGTALFDVASDTLLGVYPSPPCDSPAGMCAAIVIDGRVIGDGVELDLKSKTWKKNGLSGTPFDIVEGGAALFRQGDNCFFRKVGDSPATTPASFACPQDMATHPDGAFVWLRDADTLRLVDRTGKLLLSLGKRAN